MPGSTGPRSPAPISGATAGGGAPRSPSCTQTRRVDRTSELADRDQIDRGLRRLNDDQRTILILHFYLGMSPGEAADALDIPVGTAKSRLHYAIEALRAAIAADERCSVGAAREGRTA